jgi:ribosomal protein S18 acetylase RimI-like enzyme
MSNKKLSKKELSKSLVIKDITGGFHEDTQHLVETIYHNFEHISNEPKLRHNRKEIKRLLTAEPMYGLLIYDKNERLVAYLMGEIIRLRTGKIVYYISYLFVASKFRQLGLATSLLNIVFKKVQEWEIDGVMLICDTSDESLLNFYFKRGFSPDKTYRRNERHDVLSHYISKK